MKLEKKDWMTLKGLFVFCLFIVVLFFKYLPFRLLGIEIDNIPNILKCIYIIIVELVFIIASFIIYKDYIVKSWKDFKKNKNYYLKKYIKYWFMILIGTTILNSLIVLLNKGEIAGNEQAVRELLGNYPIYTWITGVLLAPLMEEIAFRLSLKQIFKNKWIFIIMSGIIFGSFHLISSAETWTDLLFIFPYSLPGCIFAYILYESNNIFIPIGMHFLHNGTVLCLQIILAILTSVIS